MRVYKIVILGHEGVGKTSIISKFVENSFERNYEFDHQHIFQKEIVVDNVHYSLVIFDAADTKEYWKNRRKLIKAADGFVFVFAVVKNSSLQSLGKLHSEIYEQMGKFGTPMVLVGNKNDLTNFRVVLEDEGREIARRFNCTYIETSAKTGKNVEEVFSDLVRKIKLAENTRPKPLCSLM